MDRRAHYRAILSFCIAIILLAFVAVLWLGRVEFAQDFRRYYIFFKGSVAGLSKGTEVQYNGIPVGRVIDVRIDPDNIELTQVTVEVATSLVSIKSDARAVLVNEIRSVSAIQLSGGTREAADLEPGPAHRYAVIPSGPSSLQNVHATADPWLAQLWRENKIAVIGGLGSAVLLLSYVGVFGLMLLFAPARLARIGGAPGLDDAARPSGTLGIAFDLARKAFVRLALPYLCRHPRVRRAWSERYSTGRAKLSELGKPARESFVLEPEVLDAWVQPRADSDEVAR